MPCLMWLPRAGVNCDSTWLGTWGFPPQALGSQAAIHSNGPPVWLSRPKWPQWPVWAGDPYADLSVLSVQVCLPLSLSLLSLISSLHLSPLFLLLLALPSHVLPLFSLISSFFPSPSHFSFLWLSRSTPGLGSRYRSGRVGWWVGGRAGSQWHVWLG